MFDIQDFSYFSVSLIWWLTSLCFWISSVNKISSFQFILFLSISVVCEMAFYILSCFYFYVWFESTLLFIIIIIIVWAPSPERISSTSAICMYTVLCSLPFFMIIISNPFFILFSNSLTLFSQSNHLSLFLCFSLILPFLCKLPAFLVHMWLPRAHVEASTLGSMYLASVLLNLGLLGLFRLSCFIPPIFQPVFIASVFLGAVFASLLCVTLVDLNSIVAFSSILHIATPAALILHPSSFTPVLALIILIGHGIVSPFMFYILPHLYNISTSRNILINNASYVYTPLLILVWGFVLLANLPAPPFISFFGEITIFFTLISSSYFYSMCIIFVFIYSGILFCYLYSSPFHSHPLFLNPQPSQVLLSSTLLLLMLLFLFISIPFSILLFLYLPSSTPNFTPWFPGDLRSTLHYTPNSPWPTPNRLHTIPENLPSPS